MLTLTQQNFDDIIQNNDLVIVDFWAGWCGPCLAFAPIFEQVSKAHPECIFSKINIEDEPQLASDFNIQSIPFLMIFRREFALFAQAGVQTATSLNALITDAKKIDISDLRKQVSGDP